MLLRPTFMSLFVFILFCLGCSSTPLKSIDTIDDVAIDSATDTMTTPSNDLDADGYAPGQGDCNDSDPTIHPQAPDIPADGIDQDCNGRDNDADPENGERIFANHCTDCHFDGGFDISIGSSTNYQVYIIIHYGFGPMPGFFATLSESEIFDVVLYLREEFNQ